LLKRAARRIHELAHDHARATVTSTQQQFLLIHV
jgi:hypothetical protein